MSIQFTSKKVGELLKEEDLRIPSYQRPINGTESIYVIFFMIYEMLWGKRNIRLVLLSCMKMMDT